MTTTIAVHNRKGGVAKSTSVLNLAGELTEQGLKVLSIDCDPQSTLTAFASGKIDEQIEPSATVLSAMLPERYEVDEKAIFAPAPWGGSLWRATGDLAEVESFLNGDVPGPHMRLRSALHRRAQDFDVVLIDTPPSTGKCVFNALGAADFVLVPMIADQASLSGLHKMFKTFNLVKQLEHPDLEVIGMFSTMAEERTLHYRDAMSYVRENFGDFVMRTAAVPKSTKVKDASLHKMTIRAYEPENPAGEAYRDLAENLLDRLAQRGHEFASRKTVVEPVIEQQAA